MKIISSLCLVLSIAFGCALAVAAPKEASRKIAANGCTTVQIRQAAVDAAEKAFGGICIAGKPMQTTIEVSCHVRVSLVSMATSFHVMDYLAGPGCTNLTATAETETQD